MSRVLKRVPLDFDWPMHKIWPGYRMGICDDDCENCRKFARLIGKELGEEDCPDFKIPVPSGEGYQMWETTSEGSPISPVFKTPEELAAWLAANNASTFADRTATYEEWLTMITGTGWSMSAAIINGEMISGVEYIGRKG
jgi:hypothetical protein